MPTTSSSERSRERGKCRIGINSTRPARPAPYYDGPMLVEQLEMGMTAAESGSGTRTRSRAASTVVWVARAAMENAQQRVETR